MFKFAICLKLQILMYCLIKYAVELVMGLICVIKSHGVRMEVIHLFLPFHVQNVVLFQWLVCQIELENSWHSVSN